MGNVMILGEIVMVIILLVEDILRYDCNVCLVCFLEDQGYKVSWMMVDGEELFVLLQDGDIVIIYVGWVSVVGYVFMQ